MIVYNGRVKDFINDFEEGNLVDLILSKYSEHLHRQPSPGELNSWTNSMSYMFNVLGREVSVDAQVAIEYNIPNTSKRIDFMVSGKDGENNNNIIVIELKQWSKVEAVEGKDALVKTILQGGLRETTHPSYQAFTYASLLRNFNSAVEEENITIMPCVYMHNYSRTKDDPIDSDQYRDYILDAPIYDKKQLLQLRAFLATNTERGDDGNLLYRIENGKIRPSKMLQDTVVSLLKGNQEFYMIDEQKIVFEQALYLAKKLKHSSEKQVLIVEGGPGTGKSVLAINLLARLLNENLNTCYVSKNSSPRSVYSTKLKGNKRKSDIDALFKGSGSFTETEEDAFDVIIVDEAHRLNEKSGLFSNLGEHQVKEIIHSSKLSIFFVDENQKVTLKDVGDIDTIRNFARLENAKCHQMELTSQFRCSGSDGYLAWLDQVLDIRETANYEIVDYDFKVLDSPQEVFDEIVLRNKLNNKSRLVAGYCWNWISEGKNNSEIHDITIGDFTISWNLGNSSTWAIDPESVQQAGCIHTCQGLEFDYVGVIIGEDLRYENGRIVTDVTKRARTDQSIKGIKKLIKNNPLHASVVADQIIKNTYRTLMTRGMKGCYVYCVDPGLRDYLKERIGGII